MWLPELNDNGQPKYLLLVDAIAAAIERGELKVGERLPPQRQLAWRLGLNPSTTMQAYKEAARRHLIGGEVGRGTFVLQGSKEASLFLLKNAKSDNQLIDLSTNIPVVDSHNNDLESTLQLLINNGDLSKVQYYLSAEMIMLGHLMAVEWMRLRGMELLPVNIKLCAGAQQGIFATLLSLCQSGEPVLVEQLTAPGIKAAARELHLPLHGIPLDQRGILPDELDRLVRATGAKVVVLTPILHNPTGVIMDKQRQQDVADIVLKHNLTVIEDDVYGALTSITPLSCLLPNNSLLVTSFSKTVAPGLRIGFIIGTTSLLQKVDVDSQVTNWAVSPLSLAIACQWVKDGTAMKRLLWQRAEIVQRWRLARKIIGSHMLATDSPAPHIWLETPHSSTDLVEKCRKMGVEVVPADVFSVKRSHSNGTRISLTAAKSQVELKVALERISLVLEHNVRPI